MGKKFLLAVVFIFVSSATLSQLPPTGYIGLFVDDQHFRSIICSFPGTSIAKVEMWIWCLPSERGQIGAEFAIHYESGLVPSTVIANDDIILIKQGDLKNGISFLYNECQYDWNWCFRQTIYITSHEQYIMVEITEHPCIYPTPAYRFANCEEGWPAEPVIKLANLYFNEGYYSCEPPTGTDDSSWGAIKSLYKE